MDVMTALSTTPESALALAGLENVAEWCGPAKSGVVMQLHELARGQRNGIKGFETLGGAHSDAGRKYKTVGIQPRATLIRPETWARNDTSGALVVPQVFARGVARYEDMPAVLGMHESLRMPDADQPW